VKVAARRGGKRPREDAAPEDHRYLRVERFPAVEEKVMEEEHVRAAAGEERPQHPDGKVLPEMLRRSRSDEEHGACDGYRGPSCIRAARRATFPIISVERLDQTADHGVYGVGTPAWVPYSTIFPLM